MLLYEFLTFSRANVEKQMQWRFLVCEKGSWLNSITIEFDVFEVENAKILDVHVETIGDDKTGHVTSGHISILGRIFESVWNPNAGSKGASLTLDIGADAFEGDVNLDDCVTRRLKNQDMNLLSMPILMEGPKEATLLGLVLEPVEGSEDHFVRIGLIRVRLSNIYGPYFDEYQFKYDQGEKRTIVII
jgi:hypothetical protein